MVDLIPGMGNVDWFNVAAIGQIMYWVGIVFLAIIIIVVFWIALYIMRFNIKATVIPMYGSGQDGVFSFGKPKKNRVKWVNNKTAWKSLYPLFNKIEREPFSSEFIYPGNQIYVYELENEWAPGRQNISVEIYSLEGADKENVEQEVYEWLKKKYSTTKWVKGEINVNLTENQVRAKINPVPFYVRNWQSLTYRKHELEFAKQDFWSQNKYLFITLGVVACVCALVLGTVYFTFKFAGGAKQSMDMLSQAIQGMQNIPGISPK